MPAITQNAIGCYAQLPQLAAVDPLITLPQAEATRLQNLPNYANMNDEELKELHELIITLMRINDIIASHRAALFAIQVTRHENPDLQVKYIFQPGTNNVDTLLNLGDATHITVENGNPVAVIGYDPFIYNADLEGINHLTGQKMTGGYYQGLCDISLEANKPALQQAINNPTAIFNKLTSPAGVSFAIIDCATPFITEGLPVVYKEGTEEILSDSSLFN
jgi:hypothetical protein